MNKQELVEEIKKHAIYHCGEKECYKEGCTQVVDLELVLEIVNQLGEPQKVEKEKRYRVKFIQTGQHLAKNTFPSGEYFIIKISAISSTDSFTRKELEEAGFGWVFDCPGIEIEEV